MDIIRSLDDILKQQRAERLATGYILLRSDDIPGWSYMLAPHDDGESIARTIRSFVETGGV